MSQVRPLKSYLGRPEGHGWRSPRTCDLRLRSKKKWQDRYMGVSKNNGTPKWMVKIRENPIKIDDLAIKPLFLR